MIAKLYMRAAVQDDLPATLAESGEKALEVVAHDAAAGYYLARHFAAWHRRL